ncbi:MAG TPA: cytochrome c3 family protein [Planctomycetota bacterium]
MSPRPPALLPLLLWATLARASAQEPPERLEAGQTCFTCHQALTEGHNSHRPVREGSCTLCHLQAEPDRHRFTDPPEPGKVCASCHELPARATTHAPVATHECLACHTAHHDASQPFRRNLLVTTDERALCARCHEPQSGLASTSVHPPILTGGCSSCHLAHSSYEPKLLREPEVPKCAGCHADVHAELAGAVSRHPPVGEDCRSCHDLHASPHASLLIKPERELCLDCHGAELAEYQARPFVHGALTGERGCASCHVGHVSSLPSLLAKPVRELCLACHTEAVQAPDGRTIAAVGAELAGAAHLHAPVGQGDCGACHDPHGTHTFALLRDAYPREFYVPFARESYALCFRCHQAEAFTAPETTLTAFRDGTRNLHALHVNQAKGRSCRACHTTHASTLPAGLAELVPFGQWALPLRFERTPSGGACAPGCHSRAEYAPAPRPARSGVLPGPPGSSPASTPRPN